MKKEIRGKIFLLSLVLISLITVNLILVSAADAPATTAPASNGVNNALVTGTDNLANFIKAGSGGWFTLNNTTPWLLGALLWMVLYSVLVKFGFFRRTDISATGLAWGAAIAALIITILAFMYTPTGFWASIAVQYSALGATILTIIPFAILFWFTTAITESRIIARVCWIAFVAYYFIILGEIIASYYTPDMSLGQIFFSTQTAPYTLGIIAGIIVLVLIGFFRNWFFNEELASEAEAGRKKIALFKLGIEEGGSVAKGLAGK